MKNNNSGFSLVEMVFAGAITAIVSAGAYRFLGNTQYKAQMIETKREARSAIDHLARFITRDFKLAVFGQGDTVILEDGGKRMTIQRYKSEGANGVFNVTFDNFCATFPDDIGELVDEEFQSDHNSTIYSQSNSCLRSNRCPNRQYPVVRITTDVEGTGVPVYKPSQTPKLFASDKELLKGIYSLSFCVRESGDNYAVTFEGVNLQGKSLKSSKPKFIKKTIHLKPYNNHGVRLLPN